MKKLLAALFLVAILALTLAMAGCNLSGTKSTTSSQSTSTTVTGDTSASDTSGTGAGDTSSSVAADTGTTAPGDTTAASSDTGATSSGDTTATSQDSTASSDTASTTTSATTGSAKTYKASLKGGNEVPAVTTSATGSLTLTVDAGQKTVHFTLTVSKLSNATVANLHEGSSGATGSTVFVLYAGPEKKGALTGTLVKGSFTAAGLVGPLKGKTIAELVALIKSGKIYINVGTTKNTSGEIRGQLK